MTMNTMITTNETNGNAHGGTELLSDRLSKANIPEWLTQDVQVIVSRYREWQYDKTYHIFWEHDLPGDPESVRVFQDFELLRKLDAIVFVSYQQMSDFLMAFPHLQLRKRKCFVIRNAIERVTSITSGARTSLVYTSTPQRGLNVLLDAFRKLKPDYPALSLDVFSSFGLYGWEAKDEEYQDLFDALDAEEGIVRHPKSVPNAEIHEALDRCGTFAYPSIWRETSCLCMIEAMAHGLVCVTSDLAALPETGAGFNHMFPSVTMIDNGALLPDAFSKTLRETSTRFQMVLRKALDADFDVDAKMRQMAYADETFGMERFTESWADLLAWIRPHHGNV